MEISKLDHAEVSVKVDAGANKVAQRQSAKTSIQGSTMVEQSKELSKEEMQTLSEELNQQMESLGTNVRFSYNEKIDLLYFSVTERDTGKVIRQIPSEKAMEIAEYFKNAVGLLFDKES